MDRMPPLGRLGPEAEAIYEADAEAEPIEAATPLEFLRAIYSNPGQPMHRRMRAAIAALPFEHPKLAVVASMDAGPGFAAQLEAAIRRTALLRAQPRAELGAVLAQPAAEGSSDVG